MRSLKLLAAAAILTSLIAGPVFAQESLAPVPPATETAAPATEAAATETVAPVKEKKVKKEKKTKKKKHSKKHSKKKSNEVTVGQ